MRFNQKELATVALLPSNKFEKEGILLMTEKQEGFFRRTEATYDDTDDITYFRLPEHRPKRKSLNCIGGITKVSSRWCRLRGNLLFYLKENDQFSAPLGLIVLEHCRIVIRNENKDVDGYAFYLEFKDGLCQRFAADTDTERVEWVEAIKMASYMNLNKRIKYLREQIFKFGQNHNQTTNNDEKQLLASGVSSASASASTSSSPLNVNKKEIDILEVPICESAIFCDNLLCDGQGRAPSPFIKIQYKENCNSMNWIDYSQTEIIEQCSNPQFLCTVTFRESQGLSISSSLIRFTCYDVREKLSRTSIPIGFVEISLGVIKETTRLRIPLRSVRDNPGFITIVSWTGGEEKKSIISPAKSVDSKNLGHRRSQSLPPKLGCKLFVPSHNKLNSVFINPMVHTYRLNSGLGGDISVLELMMESRICYLIPQQLLSIWIMREKELLQEISGMGELGGEWRNKQMDLLDKHLKLLKDYSQAKQNLQQINDAYFKKSVDKADESIEFVPVNLHLQRMCVHNDTLKRSGTFDIITVGAFARHTGKNKTGGLIKLLQQIKDSSIKDDQYSCKVEAANDAVQAIKHLRKEIVEIMSQLLTLAKSRNPKGMLPLCNEMVNKTRTLLNIWEPSLVEEALTFIEQNRIIEEPDNSHVPISPFKKITQQLGALDLKSPELEDFATPIDPWPKSNLSSSSSSSMRNTISTSLTSSSGGNRSFHGFHHCKKSPSVTDINAISAVQDTVKIYNNQVVSDNNDDDQQQQIMRTSYCSTISQKSNDDINSMEIAKIRFNETHFDVSSEIIKSQQQITNNVICNEIVIHNEHSNNNSPKIIMENINCNQNIENSWSNNSVTDNDSNNKLPIEIATDSYEIDYNPMNCTILLGQNGCFLDTKEMSTSPSANYYRPTEEPEPLDLTQLNIEASVMCLLSKVKFLCGRCGSPAVRLRQRKTSLKRVFNNSAPDVITNQPNISNNSQPPINVSSNNIQNGGGGGKEPSAAAGVNTNNGIGATNEKDLNLALTEVTRRVKTGNKFTDGLDISMDWAAELRPSMRKLRQAMDGLLKTSRLMHSVQRLQQDMRKISTNLAVMYRRDVCFSQALTSLVSGLMAKLWGTVITEKYFQILSSLGPLAYFEGLLSLYGNEIDMWGDMCVAIEDLSAVTFTLVRSNIQREHNGIPVPRIIGSRQSLNVLLPIPENVYEIMPTNKEISFKVTPVFFNIGINERATLSETLGYTRDQHRSNWDNFDRLKQYHIRYKKLNLSSSTSSSSCTSTSSMMMIIDSSAFHHNNSRTEINMSNETISDLLQIMEENLRNNTSKNVKILHIAEDICRGMYGIRFTSCKSAKDRTGMSATLEQCRTLQQEFHLPISHMQKVLNTMRTEGTRADNLIKNIGKKKYAFSLPQVLSLPGLYRPPAGSYGKVET